MNNFKELIRKFNDKRSELIYATKESLSITFFVGIIGLDLISLVISVIFTSLNLVYADMPQEELMQYNAYSSFISYLIAFVIILATIGPRVIKVVTKQFAKKEALTDGFIYAVILLLANIFCSLFASIIYPNAPTNDNQGLIEALVNSQPFLMFVIVVIIGPMFEEIVYRFGLFGLCYRKNRLFAYTLAGMVFALIHFNFKTIGTNDIYSELIALPSYIAGGLVLCRAYEKNGSIATSYIAHMANNLLSVLMVLFYR